MESETKNTLEVGKEALKTEDDGKAAIGSEAVLGNSVPNKPPSTTPAEKEPSPAEEAESKQPEVKARRGGRTNLNRGPLTEKEECPDCKKVLSKHSLIYNTHKCAAKTRKNVVVENIQAPVEKAQQPAKDTQPKAPKNYIDLDGDIDYSHLNVHNIIHGYVSFTRNKEREQKQQRYRSMLAGRL